ncbi:uncharacterized protein LOC143286557 [Babylonia areolata]|uniref:uncharacterized protein LOC143286557 n=1 Tax=Babylonia areolata TaxID=304850 RepID=UPI003FD12730
MSQFKITAVEGLKTQGESDSVWDDFYTEEKEEPQKAAGPEKAFIQVENEATYDDDFEDVDDDDDDDDDEEGNNSRETPRITLNLSTSSRDTSMEKLDDTDSQTSSHYKPRRKGGKAARKLKTTGSNNNNSNKPPPLNLYQDQIRDHLRYSRDRSLSFNHQQQETMSDQEGRRRRGGGRKLQHRGQMKKYRSLEQAVEQAGKDRLEQKFVELQELMSRPLVVDSLKVYGPPALQKTQGASKKQQQQQLQEGRRGRKGDDPEHRLKAWISNSTLDEDEGTDRQAYSTLRKLQTSGSRPRKLNGNANHHTTSNSENGSHQSQPNTKLTAKPPVPRRRKTSEDSVPSTTSETSHPGNDGNSKLQENGLHPHLTSEKGEDDQFGNVSPRSVYLPADMHLKYTDNPKLQDWLRRKNTEFRQARKAERAKKREERLEKQTELEEKALRREKSSERVKQWMDLKRKEAARHQKEERRRRKQEAQEQATLRAKNAENAVRGNRIDRPQSAPSASKKHIPIKRPESAARLENGAYTAPKSPKPPDTKFVYKRPVSGRVRLMKMQNEKNAKARNAEQKRLEELSPEEKEKKMRMSYDAWLMAKRKEEGEKRKEVKRQEDLIKSDPEVDRLVPELAIRRIEKINNDKKNIDTGVNLIDDDVNKRFGGGLFGKDEDKPSLKHDSVLEPSLYNLAVEGSASTLVELNSRARPTAAKTRMPIPQCALSPRRPQTAKPSRDSSPKVRAIMDVDHMSEPNPFKLPFSDEYGALSHARRERSSSKHTPSQSGDKRPEPQGCASVEHTSCPKGDEGPRPCSFPKGLDSSPKPDTTTPRSSLVLLQEIEAAAIQSEQDSKPVIPEKTSASSVKQPPNSESGDEPQELVTADPVQCADTPEDTRDKAGDEEKKAAEESVDIKREQTQGEDQEEAVVENQQEDPSPEEGSGQEPQAPDTTQELQTPNGVTLDAKEKTEEEQLEKQPVASEPSCSENLQHLDVTGDDNNTPEQQGSEAEDTPGRSLKRVSFSEDLTTVFQPSSPDTSSNFEDERGMDDEGEDPYMSLDDAPEPV